MKAITTARLRRAVRRDTIGVDIGGALNLVGAMLKWLSLAALFPAAIALGYSEPVWPFLVAAAIAAAFGWGLEHLTHGKERISAREGFLVVSLTWLVGAAFVALPYLLSNDPQLDRPVDAFFESMSGMTTTGASVLTDVPAVDHSIAMWRQFSQWFGGMGIIVLGLAVLPRLRVGGRQLMESEAPGPELEALATSIRETARRLYLTYIGLSALMVLVLSLLAWTGADPAMSFYEAVAHMFTTMPTGGFSTRARSFEEFGAASQWVVAAFMVLAGTNFALHYRALVRRMSPFRDEEFRLYLGLLGVATLIVFVELLVNDLFAGEAALRHAVFQVTSIMTTTGFASTDFNEWVAITPLAALTLVFLMLIGGCAGSTAGAIKVVRLLLVGRLLRRELDETVHPEIVTPVRLNGRPIDERTLRAIVSFTVLYLAFFLLGALAILLDSARAGVDASPFDAIATAATMLGNVGPAFGFGGPMGSFEPFSDVSTGIMIALMWVGRLEIIPIAVLLTKVYWRA